MNEVTLQLKLPLKGLPAEDTLPKPPRQLGARPSAPNAVWAAHPNIHHGDRATAAAAPPVLAAPLVFEENEVLTHRLVKINM